MPLSACHFLCRGARAFGVLVVFAAMVACFDARAGAPDAAPVPDVTEVAGPQTEGAITDAQITGPPLRLTSDRTQVLTLPRPAGSVMVGNPKHLGALVENPLTLVLVPREPGSSFLTVLGPQRDVILARHVIVGTPKSQYLRVRQNCAGGGSDCQALTTYYCPDMCHPIVPDVEGETGGAGPGAENSGIADIVIPEMGDI